MTNTEPIQQLVLSGIEFGFLKLSSVKLLGRWTFKFIKKNSLLDVVEECVEEPWNDRRKLYSDHCYLEIIHENVLEQLSLKLNQFHDVNYSKRYWRTLLDPWLVSYLGVIFDRWERVGKAFSMGQGYTIMALKNNHEIKRPFWAGIEFHEIIQDDVWNHLIFTDIIKYRYLKKAHFYECDGNLPFAPTSLKQSSGLHNIFRKIRACASLIILEKILGSYSSARIFLGYKPKRYLAFTQCKFWTTLKLRYLVGEDPFVDLLGSTNIRGLEMEASGQGNELLGLDFGDSPFLSYLNISLARDLPNEYWLGISLSMQQL